MRPLTRAELTALLATPLGDLQPRQLDQVLGTLNGIYRDQASAEIISDLAPRVPA